MHIFIANIMPDGLWSRRHTTIVTNHLIIVQFHAEILNIIAKIFKNNVSFLLDLVLDVILLVGQFAVEVPDEFVFEVV
jgi:hypothetical protein